MCVAETVKIEKLPTISEAQHKNNLEEYSKSQKDIEALQAEIDAKKKRKDNLEVEMHNYEQRNGFENNLVHELTNNAESLKAYKTWSNTKAKEELVERKKADNGIDRGWFSGVTEPTEKSRAALEYARIQALTDGKYNGTTKLEDEHIKYRNIMIATILPKLAEDLNNRNDAMETLYLRGFKECGLTNFDCLASYSITKEQMKPEFIQNFVNAPSLAAYKRILEHNIPITEKELAALIAGNKLTKEAVEKSNKNKEAFEAAINPQAQPEKEKIDLTKEQPEPKKDPVDLKQ